MRIGQTSVVVFMSRILGSALGFVATVYFARTLGAEILGIYATILAVVSWLELGGRLGVGGALKKRISEGEDQDEYLGASILLMLALYSIIIVSLFLGQGLLDSYVPEYGGHITIPLYLILAIILFLHLSYAVSSLTLKGLNLVHIPGLLQPLRITVRGLTQIALVTLGYSLLGLFIGYTMGILFVLIISITYIPIRYKWPEASHFRSLVNYARYSWLGGLTSRTFGYADILVLGALVPSTLIGIYSVTWTLAKFLDLFGSAVKEAVFPEISGISAQEGVSEAAIYIENAVAFSGLIVIPGLFGGTILAERLLRIYSPEFIPGTEVLPFLLLAILFYTFMRQFLNSLNALDYPGKSFRVNVVFVISNITLNILLVWEIGWVGAAIASAVSTAVGLCLSYILLKQIVSFSLPYVVVGKQFVAAILMGLVLLLIQQVIDGWGLQNVNFIIVTSLVCMGAIIYMSTLFLISSRFRTVVIRNIPVTNVSLI